MDIEELDKRYLWHPYTQMSEMLSSKIRVIVRGEGFYLIDKDGNKYIDAVSSMWCNVWGHNNIELINAIKEQLYTLPHSSLFGLSNDKAILLAEMLCKLTKLDKVFYAENGSSAVEVAIKMAIQYWRNINEPKYNIISLKHGYHGDTIGSISVGYIEDFFSNYKDLLFNVKRLDSPYLFRKSIDMSDDDYINYCIDIVEQALKENPACMIMESGAQLAGGVIIYPQNYQAKISELCKKYDTLLILDEIATGFGRLGNMIEFIAQNSMPDIAIFGKMLTGGYLPLSAVLTSNKIYNAFLDDYYKNKQLFHGHTFTGHPLGCVAALTNIQLYEKYKLIEEVRRKSSIIKNRLEEFKSNIIGDIRHKGMVAGIELVKPNSKEPLRFRQSMTYTIMDEGFKRGVYIRPLGNVMLIIPALAIDDHTLNKVLDIAYDIIKSLERINA